MKRLVYLFKYCKLLLDMKTYGGGLILKTHLK